MPVCEDPLSIQLAILGEVPLQFQLTYVLTFSLDVASLPQVEDGEETIPRKAPD